jgi:hypothetical protein
MYLLDVLAIRKKRIAIELRAFMGWFRDNSGNNGRNVCSYPLPFYKIVGSLPAVRSRKLGSPEYLQTNHHYENSRVSGKSNPKEIWRRRAARIDGSHA